MADADTFLPEELSIKDSGLKIKSRILYLGPFIVRFVLHDLGKSLIFSKFVVFHFYMNTKDLLCLRECCKESIPVRGEEEVA